MSTISASTTSTTAYKVTADTTGTLVLQTGSTPTTAMTINSAQNVGINASGPKNPDGYNTTNFKFLTVQATTGGTDRGALLELVGTAGGSPNYWLGRLGFFSTSNSNPHSSVYSFTDSAGANSGKLIFGTTTDASTTAPLTRMTVSAEGYVTKGYQPAFYAWFNNGGSNQSFANNASPFTVVFDIAGGSGGSFSVPSSAFNVSTGRFTAPVAGKYFVSTNLAVYTLDGVYISDCGVGLKKNGSSLFLTEQQVADTAGSSSNFTNWCFATVVDLAANDYIEVYINPFGSTYQSGNGNIGSGTRTNFSGYLLG